jgi:hypothetical protein
MDTVGRSSEKGAILGANESSRRDGGAVAEDSEVMAARAEIDEEKVGAGEAAERRGSSMAPSASECLMV